MNCIDISGPPQAGKSTAAWTLIRFALMCRHKVAYVDHSMAAAMERVNRNPTEMGTTFSFMAADAYVKLEPGIFDLVIFENYMKYKWPTKMAVDACINVDATRSPNTRFIRIRET